MERDEPKAEWGNKISCLFNNGYSCGQKKVLQRVTSLGDRIINPNWAGHRGVVMSQAHNFLVKKVHLFIF